MRILSLYLWYRSVQTPCTITFKPFRAYVIHKSYWKTDALTESSEKLSQYPHQVKNFSAASDKP